MLSIFKKREIKKDEQKEEQLENIKMIAVPDIIEYMIQGYKEIEQIKTEKQSIEQSRDNYKADSKKFEKLYDATLVTLNEFKRRDIKNEEEIKRLKERYENEQIMRETDNKENKKEINKLQEDIIILNNKLTKAEKESIRLFKTTLIKKVKETKGNLSKEKIIEIINKEAE